MLYMMGLGALIFETEGVILVVDFPALPVLMYVSAGKFFLLLLTVYALLFFDLPLTSWTKKRIEGGLRGINGGAIER